MNQYYITKETYTLKDSFNPMEITKLRRLLSERALHVSSIMVMVVQGHLRQYKEMPMILCIAGQHNVQYIISLMPLNIIVINGGPVNMQYI